MAALLCAWIPPAVALSADAPWPMYRHDARRTGQSECAGPQAGNLAWRRELPDIVKSGPAMGADGTIYVGCGGEESGGSSLYALAPDGSILWSFGTGGGVESSPAIGQGGTLYAGSWDGNFYALSPSGSPVWSYPTGPVASSPAVGADGTICVMSVDSTLYVFSPAGKLQWSAPGGGWGKGSPAIGDDGTVYAPASGSAFAAYDSAGTLAWTYGGPGTWGSPAVGAEGEVYVKEKDSGVLCCLSSSGSLSWSYDTGNVDYAPPVALGSDGTVYAAPCGDCLCALTSAGAVRWSYHVGYDIYCAPVVGSDGTVYAGSDDVGGVCAFGQDGELRWGVATGRAGDSPAIGSDGRLYVGSLEHGVYCVSTEGGVDPDPEPGLDLRLNALLLHPGDTLTADVAVEQDLFGPFDAYCVIVGPGGAVYSVTGLNRIVEGIAPMAGPVFICPEGYVARLLDMTLGAVQPGGYTIICGAVPAGTQPSLEAALCYDTEEAHVN